MEGGRRTQKANRSIRPTWPAGFSTSQRHAKSRAYRHERCGLSRVRVHPRGSRKRLGELPNHAISLPRQKGAKEAKRAEAKAPVVACACTVDGR